MNDKSALLILLDGANWFAQNLKTQIEYSEILERKEQMILQHRRNELTTIVDLQAKLRDQIQRLSRVSLGPKYSKKKKSKRTHKKKK